MPHRLCLEPRCPNPVTGRGRCDSHRKELERDRSRRRRERTKGTYKTKMWQRRRMQVFSRDPFCMDGRVCEGKAPSMEVDHVIPLDLGGAPYAMDNLRGTCAACHQAKTTEENHNRNRTGGRVPMKPLEPRTARVTRREKNRIFPVEKHRAGQPRLLK